MVPRKVAPALRPAIRRFGQRLRHALWPGSGEDELARETAAHLTLLEDDYRRRGLTPDAARVAARRAFGGVEQMKDRQRDARSFVWLDDARRDLQHAVRMLRRTPGFAAIATLTLALGIGANTAIFSVVNAVLWRPLPYGRAAQLVRVWENVPGSEIGDGKGPGWRYPAMDLRDVIGVSARSRTLTAIVAFTSVWPTLTIDGQATRMEGFSVSAGMFAMLGVAPEAGRTFAPEEGVAGREQVMVLSHDAAQRFGGTERVVGRTVTFGGDPTNPMLRGVSLNVPYAVIGVMPHGFKFPYDNAQFWVPYVLTPPASPRISRIAEAARLADGVSPEAAAAELERIRRDLRGATPAAAAPRGGHSRFEIRRLQDELTDPVRPALLVLTAAVGVVLLIACVNMANLLLARTASRQREMAVRAAIGAGRGRLVRQLLTESLLLSTIGGAAGIALAFAGVRLFRVLGTTLGRTDLGLASVFPRLAEVSVDSTVLAYASIVSIATGIIFGIVPALRDSRPRHAEALREATSSSSRSRLKNLLVVLEMALATLLCVGGGLLINSFAKLATVDPGFDAAHLLTFQVNLSASRGAEDQKAFAEALMEQLRSTPGIESAAYARQLPMVQLQDSIRLSTRRDGVEQPLGQAADIRFVSRDYLKTMGIRVLSGRGFTEADEPGQPGAMVINDAMARRDFHGESPLGQTVFLGRPPRVSTFTIVGVVANVRQQGLEREPQPQYFLDYRQLTASGFASPPLFPVGAYYSVRTSAGNAAVLAGIRTAVRALDAHATIDNVATMEQIVSNSITRPRMYAVLIAILSSVAISLAAIGLYGVMAYAVAQRSREIGIRRALGARDRQVVRLVLRQSAQLTIVGLALGLAGAIAVTSSLEGLLFGLTPLDPTTFIAVAVLFVAVATLASYVPARRATRVDPLVALRCE